jgi:phage anti-repressor protein
VRVTVKVERWQAEKFNQAVGLMLRYLGLLRERMEKTGFLQSDKFFQLVSKAYDAVYSLSVEAHYLSCEGGVGRETR